jgi:hypothetical protein
MGRASRGSGIALAAAVAFLATAASPARAELVARGNLFVTFEGGIEPAALPRDVPAPISVSVAGTVRTLTGERPPALRRIVVELNRAGRLDVGGLPVCRAEQIEASSAAAALAVCDDALVGTGAFSAETAFPEQTIFPSRGRILAFNAREDGHPIILAHVFARNPVASTRLIVFHISHPAGPYGTRLDGSLPRSLNPHGYIKHISLHLFRLYRYRGATHSYLSAACAAPPGFGQAIFPFARASMGFGDGRNLHSTLTRSCYVRH